MIIADAKAWRRGEVVTNGIILIPSHIKSNQTIYDTTCMRLIGESYFDEAILRKFEKECLYDSTSARYKTDELKNIYWYILRR